ncbi:MAG: hypothetical protein WC700_14230 [Gemmatimonadaceae bacterium]|jgi:hypothetical protein
MSTIKRIQAFPVARSIVLYMDDGTKRRTGYSSDGEFERALKALRSAKRRRRRKL